jgi:hypothetical protein
MNKMNSTIRRIAGTCNMKLQYCLIGTFCLFAVIVFGQTNQHGKLVIPFLDEESQSNLTVTVVSDPLGDGQPCPPEFTNTLSNTNLFTPEEQRLIKDVFVKYADVTTNSGPHGTKLVALYKTNVVYQLKGKTVNSERLIGQFQYTNSDGKEEIAFGTGLSAKYRSESDDGYNVYIVRTGSGSILSFTAVRKGRINGVLAQFYDLHPQGMNWDYKHASLTNSVLAEYRHITNGLVFGNYFLWDIKGRLMLAAEFKEPYDFEKHRVQWP